METGSSSKRPINIEYAVGTNKFREERANIQQVTSGSSRFVTLATCARPGIARRRIHADQGIILKLGSYGTLAPTLSDLLPRATIERLLNRYSRGAVGRGGRVAIKTLKLIFGMSDEEVTKFVGVVQSHLLAQPKSTLFDATPALAKFHAACLARYDKAADEPIAWWITQDPGRQFTASLDPRVEDPAAWYGKALYSGGSNPPPTTESALQSVLAAIEAKSAGPMGSGEKKTVYSDGCCPLCQEPVSAGSANTVVLPCGHVFHWAGGDVGCRGLLAWTESHLDCPICRHPFAGESEDEAEDHRSPRVPIAIEW